MLTTILAVLSAGTLVAAHVSIQQALAFDGDPNAHAKRHWGLLLAVGR